MYDVVVVGAGPAGSIAAYECTKRGLKTVLLEKCTLPRDKPCGGAVMYRGLQIISGEIPRNIVEQKIYGLRFLWPNNDSAEFKSDKLIGVTVFRNIFDEFLPRVQGHKMASDIMAMLARGEIGYSDIPSTIIRRFPRELPKNNTNISQQQNKSFTLKMLIGRNDLSFVVILLRSVVVALLFLSMFFVFVPTATAQHTPLFDGDSAFVHLEAQCAFGPRPPGSDNLTQCRRYIADMLVSFGWEVRFQNFTYLGTNCSNIIAYIENPNTAPLVLGAHYDTRPLADNDPSPSNRTYPVLGANDGASGVAILLELARILPQQDRHIVELVFFDAEDSGRINGWDWIVGSTYYVDQLDTLRKNSVRAMLLLDMVGDASLQLPKEISSTDTLQNEVWHIAAELGHSDVFLNQTGSTIIDDHRPFLDAGIPALDIIQTPFPWYWHTREDTPDKCSGSSLEVVGSVIETFLIQQLTQTTPFEQESPVLLYVSIIIGVMAIVIIFLARRRYRM